MDSSTSLATVAPTTVANGGNGGGSSGGGSSGNGNGNGNGNTDQWLSSSHWQQQLQMAQLSRQTISSPHSYARSAAIASRTASGQNPVPLTVTELAIQLVQQNQQANSSSTYNGPMRGGAAVGAAISAGGSLGNGISGNQQQKKEQIEEERQRRINEDINKQFWTAIDLSGQGLSNITPKLFNYNFLQKLYLNHNKLTSLPASVTKLNQLKVLDLSDNLLTELPPELGVVFSLKYLFLFDNKIQSLPYELGSLFQLEVLGLEGNPINEHTREVLAKEGTRGVIIDLRERAPVNIESHPREWLLFEDDGSAKERQNKSEKSRQQQKNQLSESDDKDVAESENTDKDNINNNISSSSITQSQQSSSPSSCDISIMTYNTLCDKYATPQMYGYTPSWALGWKYRSELLKEQIISFGTDIICLQEVDGNSFDKFWTPELSQRGYKGIYWPKTRARTMTESESKKVDGCATFYRSSVFKLVEYHCLEYNSLALRKDDLKKTADIYNRVMNKDNIAIITIFERIQTGQLFVVGNTHLEWNPAFKDVKLVQVALLLEESERAVDKYSSNSNPDGAKYPRYTDAKNIPVIICGDFNSTSDSGVYQLFSQGKIGKHEDLEGRIYGRFTEEGMTHRLSLKSAYNEIGELPFTNYTPNFAETIDYIWYSTTSLSVSGLLGQIDPEYTKHFVGFPNAHHPSDHIPIASQFNIKKIRDAVVKPTAPPNFGNSSNNNYSGSSRKT